MKYYVLTDREVDPVEVNIERSREGTFLIETKGSRFELDAEQIQDGRWSVVDLNSRSTHSVDVQRGVDASRAILVDQHLVEGKVMDARTLRRHLAVREAEASGAATIKAPMPGKVVTLLKEVGDEVNGGEGVIVVEAMKMENELKAPKPGRIAKIIVAEGDAVEAKQALVEIEAL